MTHEKSRVSILLSFLDIQILSRHLFSKTVVLFVNEMWKIIKQVLPSVILMLLGCTEGGNGSCAIYCEKDSNTGQSCCKQFPISIVTQTEKILTEQLIAKVNEQAETIKYLQIKVDGNKQIGTAPTVVDMCQDDPNLCEYGKCVNLKDDYFCACYYGYPETDRRSCLLPRSCQEIFNKQSVISGTYSVSPDGVNTLTVKCDMNFMSNKRMTEIGHNLTPKTDVDGEVTFSWFRNINYGGNISAVISLVDRSTKCQQYMQYECKGSVMTWDNNNDAKRTMENPWLDRNGNKVNRFGGAAKNHTCPCFDTGTCNKNSTGDCNCDLNDVAVWLEDSGYETDRQLLPVTRVYGSDTGNASEAAKVTLGNLQCWG